MCFDGKCCLCIPVDVGSVILGVFASIINALGILGCIGGLVYVNGFLYKARYSSCIGSYCASISYPEHYPNNNEAVTISANAALSVVLVLLLIDFAFSVTLADGANKEKAGHVKTYFVYGIVKFVLFIIADITLFVLLIPVGIIMLMPIAIYGLLLVMVYQTYTKFRRGGVYGGLIMTSNVDHVPLV